MAAETSPVFKKRLLNFRLLKVMKTAKTSCIIMMKNALLDPDIKDKNKTTIMGKYLIFFVSVNI